MLNERKLTKNELDQRDIALKGLVKNKRSLVKKYGKDAEKVMYGIATKQAKQKQEAMNLENLKGMIEAALANPDKADFNKDKHKLMLERKCTKVRMIKENNEKVKDTLYLTCNYFNFVVPTGLVTPDEVPEYAGLIYMDENLNFEIIKKAPLLHKEKASYNFIRQLSHNLTCKLVFNKINS